MNIPVRPIATTVLALGAAVLASTAQARSDLSWSIGISMPGYPVGVGAVVSNGPLVAVQPVYVAPAPVVYVPQPVWAYPALVAPPPWAYGRAFGHEGRRHGHGRENGRGNFHDEGRRHGDHGR